MYGWLLLIVWLVFLIVAARDLRLGLCLLAAALPSYLLRFSLFGFPCTFLEALILTLLFIWLLQKKWRDFAWSCLRPWGLPLLLLLLSASLGLLIAPDNSAALGIWKAYFIEPAVVFLIALSTLKRSDLPALFRFLALGAILVAAFALLQKFTGFAIPPPWDAEGRVTSIFPYPNAVGLYLGPLCVLAFFSITDAIKLHDRRWVAYWSFVLFLSVPAIIFAQSEAVFLALPLSLLIFSLMGKPLRRPAACVAAAVVLLILFVPTVRQIAIEKITLQDFSGQVRLSQWQETVPFLKDHPFFGAGLSGYPTAIKLYHQRFDLEIFQYPHNIILNFWVEIGLLGLLALTLLLWQIGRRLRSVSWPGLAAAAAFLEMGIHGLVDVPYFKNDLAVLCWLLLAVLIIDSYVRKIDAPQKNSV